MRPSELPLRRLARIIQVLAVAAFLSAAAPGWAGGHGGGGGHGGTHGGGFHGGGFHGGFHGGSFHGGWGGYGWGGYGYGWGGYGWGWPGYAWGWPGYGWDYAPGYYPGYDLGYPGYSGAATMPNDGLAHFRVTVPAADAQVWLNGQRTEQTGKDRHFKSPPIAPGKDYSYEVRARWLENGRSVERTQMVVVRANQRLSIDVAKPSSALDSVAHLKVVVPVADAEVWLNGTRTAQTGTERRFKSPPIAPGKDYEYEVRARWLENGQAVERTQTVMVQIGKQASVNLTKPVLAASK
jgi:uncharacterized protein (TIGR03000 family)